MDGYNGYSALFPPVYKRMNAPFGCMFFIKIPEKNISQEKGGPFEPPLFIE